MFKVNDKTPERRQWRRSGVFMVNFEFIVHLFLVFLLLTLNKEMLAGKVVMKCLLRMFFTPFYYDDIQLPFTCSK